MEYILLFISASLVNNFILSRFLGTCPFMGVSKSLDTAYGMSFAVAFVMIVSSVATWLFNTLVLIPFNLIYLQTIIFIVIIAVIVQFVEMVVEKNSPELHTAMGIYLPLITTNCAVLGVVLLNVQTGYGFFKMLIFTAGSAAGFGIALILFAGLRERMIFSDTPKAFQGMPVALITASILALAFMGFSGMVK